MGSGEIRIGRSPGCPPVVPWGSRFSGRGSCDGSRLSCWHSPACSRWPAAPTAPALRRSPRGSPAPCSPPSTPAGTRRTAPTRSTPSTGAPSPSATAGSRPARRGPGRRTRPTAASSAPRTASRPTGPGRSTGRSRSTRPPAGREALGRRVPQPRPGLHLRRRRAGAPARSRPARPCCSRTCRSRQVPHAVRRVGRRRLVPRLVLVGRRPARHPGHADHGLRPRRRRRPRHPGPGHARPMLAYLGTTNARLVRAAFSHDALRP